MKLALWLTISRHSSSILLITFSNRAFWRAFLSMRWVIFFMAFIDLEGLDGDARDELELDGVPAFGFIGLGVLGLDFIARIALDFIGDFPFGVLGDSDIFLVLPDPGEDDKPEGDPKNAFCRRMADFMGVCGIWDAMLPRKKSLAEVQKLLKPKML